MREDVLRNLLEDIGLRKVKRRVGRKGVNFAFLCPFHGERNNPSAGVLIDGHNVYGSCFSCKETFTLPKLVAECNGTSILDALDWLAERYNVTYREYNPSDKALRRYEDAVDELRNSLGRVELPYFKLAPYRSGKEVHKYFFERGFSKEDAKIHMLGWDRVKKRITIPFFHSDGVLAGFSGRAVLDEKLRDGSKNPAYERVYGNLPKYLLYDNVPIGQLLYGSHNYRSKNKTAYLVEGLFDRIWMYKNGYTDALATIVAKMAFDERKGVSEQAQILHKLGVENVVLMHDADDAGADGKELAYEILRNDFQVYDTEYPDDFKDCVGMPQLEIELMIENKWRYGKRKGSLRRYE